MTEHKSPLILDMHINCRILIKCVSAHYDKGYTVAQLIEALPYKPEGRGFDSPWSHWNFSVTLSFWSHCGPETDSASNNK
jgi:hypothetical protein